MLCCPESNLKWTEGEESQSSDVKIEILDVEKLVFCSVAIGKKVSKEIVIFHYFRALELR